MTTAVVQGTAEPRCRALNLSDSQQCADAATAYDGLFCRFHARQCFGLYMGYKRRNAELDALARQEPAFLRNSATSLVSQTFDAVESEEELRELHNHLFRRYVLLGKVISARRLHHKHYFPVEMDYGHKAYLDKLVSARHSVLKALESLERRTAALLYEKEKWFAWVRQVQQDEDQHREKEQKKIKLEAALFRRHWREMEARLAAARQKEERKRQEAYLDDVWKERMMADTASEDSDDADWDPIEDVFEDDRGRYIDLIRHFLWMEAPARENGEAQSDHELPSSDSKASEIANEEAAVQDFQGEALAVAVQEKKKPRKRGGKKKNQLAQSASGPGQELAAAKQEPEPNKSMIESRDDIMKRLKEGVEKDYSHVNGPMLVGTAQNPAELFKRTAPVKDEDAAQLVADIAEIKMLLFRRQLMSNSALLPAALRANSVDEFLADPSIADADLRDLCLQVEQPSLQALRDACADFARGDEPDDDSDEANDDDTDRYQTTLEYLRRHSRYKNLEPDLHTALYCGEIRRSIKGLIEQEPREQKMQVRICGRRIWNYTSQRSMPRAGWLHFSIMAKDCSFPDAIALCRNWDEFFELNALSLWQYFPASRWTGWSGNFLTQELTQMGFVPFYMDMSAQQTTTYNHLDKLSRKVLRRQHTVVESRNFVCAHMKRNTAVTRRFIQYALMRPGEHLILVIDGKNGRVVVAPPAKHCWIARSRPGVAFYGRQSEDDWDEELLVDHMFLEFARSQCKWHFGFTDYYEIYMWDYAPGGSPMNMYHRIRDLLHKAHRVRGNRGKYAVLKPIMETLTREPDTMRVRQIKPGEEVQSLYDELASPSAEFWLKTSKTGLIRTSEDVPPGISPYVFYNDTDAAEDAVLFEDEPSGGLADNAPFVEIQNPTQQLESSSMPLSILNRTAEQMEEELPRVVEETLAIRRTRNQDGSVSALPPAEQPYVPGAGQFPYSAPPVWVQAHKLIADGPWDPTRAMFLDKLDFGSIRLELSMDELKEVAKTQEILERDRAYIFKDTFHLGDLVPGAQDRYKEAMDIIIGVQKYQSPHPQQHDQWAWFCMDVLDRLNLKLYYDDFNFNVSSPWPHRYIVQDIVQAFMAMGLFFPGVKETSIIHEYLESEQGRDLKAKASQIFDPASRRARRPDVRTRTSMDCRPKKFWKEWDELYPSGRFCVDTYPWDSSMAIRPIIAKLYKAGMIAPAAREPHPSVVPGYAAAGTEPHRPGQLDLFIHFKNMDAYTTFPPSFVHYRDWPELLPAAREFASKCEGKGMAPPRFALLRLWSAPHFYPLMVKASSRGGVSFFDPAGRVWEWKFIPKDIPASEWSIHNMVMLRLGFLREQMAMGQGQGQGGCGQLDERVLHRGDLVLVMGEDERDLLWWCTAVTFALQTKPWLREVDLWKSFVNVDLGFLEGLDEHWLD